MKRRCASCGELFITDCYHPHQKYCRKVECQRYRRNEYQKKKLRTDADYRANQYAAQAKWRETHSHYWKEYRASHPAYVERNRILSRARCSTLLLSHSDSDSDFAKMNIALPQLPLKSGRYRLEPYGQKGFAKMGVAIVQLSLLEPLTNTR